MVKFLSNRSSTTDGIDQNTVPGALKMQLSGGEESVASPHGRAFCPKDKATPRFQQQRSGSGTDSKSSKINALPRTNSFRTRSVVGELHLRKAQPYQATMVRDCLRLRNGQLSQNSLRNGVCVVPGRSATNAKAYP